MGDDGGAERIRVFCRVRPSRRPSGFFTLMPDNQLVDFTLPQDVDRNLVHGAKDRHQFRFDGLFNMGVAQDEVFDQVAKEAVDSALDGYNSTVFAYGQTGSGKTFTITGGAEKYQDRGLIPRSLQRIFAAMKSRTDVQYTAYISYLEIYNESGYDLLDPSQESKALEELPKVSLMEDEDGNVHLRGLSMHMASSEEEALNLLFLGDTNRAIAETPMNMASSRSHCIFTISLESRQEGSSTVKRSKLHLVDLAGSERVSKTGAAGQLFKEATFINKSLHYLELVIVALHEQRKGNRTHIPYRNSIMTSVLRDSLGGNCKTTMIATINPELEHTNESISTCRFAQRVARVQNSAKLNEETDPHVLVSQMKTKVSALEQEVAYLKAKESGESGDETLSETDIESINTAARTWIDGPDNTPFTFGPMTLERIKAAFLALRIVAISFKQQAGGGGSDQRLKHGYLQDAAPDTGGGASPRRAAGQGASSSGAATDAAGYAGGSGDAALVSALREEVKRLKSLTTQRDNEVALLVDVVKKLRAGQPVGQGAPPVQLAGLLQKTGTASSIGTMDAGGHVTPGRPATTPAASSVPSQPMGVVVENGVLATPEILADRDRSFDLFRTVYPKHQTIEDNKALLKSKYDEAKAVAEQVNAARSETNRLKQEIERVRVEVAMANIVETGGAGGGKAADEASIPEGPEETRLRSDLEAHKAAYKSSFQRLRDLKAEIEHIQRLLEAARLKMQADFEGWYSDKLLKLNQQTQEETAKLLGGGPSAGASSSAASTPARPNTGPASIPAPQGAAPQQQWPGGAGYQPMTMGMPQYGQLPPPSPYLGYTPYQQQHHQQHHPGSQGPAYPMQNQPPYPTMPVGAGSMMMPVPGAGGASSVPASAYGWRPLAAAGPSGPAASAGFSYPYPPGPAPGQPAAVPYYQGAGQLMPPSTPGTASSTSFVSTGSADADTDIAAFYRAKEELLRRTKLASAGSAGSMTSTAAGANAAGPSASGPSASTAGPALPSLLAGLAQAGRPRQ